MDSLTLVERAFDAPSSGGPDDGSGRSEGEPHLVEEWLRRHWPSLAWFLPIFVLGTIVQVVALGDREAAPASSVLTGGASAVVLASASAVLLWMLARRLRFSRPIATAALLLFLFSPLALIAHTTASVQNALVPVMLVGAIVLVSRRAGRRLRMIVASLLGVALVIALLFDPAGQASIDPTVSRGLAGWWSLDPALLIVATAASLISLALRRLRAFGAVALALTVVMLAFVPEADMSGATVAVWLPLAALLVAGVVQVAVEIAFDIDFTKLWLEVLSGLFLVAVAGVFIFAAPALASAYRSIAAGAPAVPGASPGAGGADLVPGAAAVLPAGVAADTPTSPTATPLTQPSPSVDPGAAAQSATAGQAVARASAGLQLSTNPNVTLSPGAEALLVAGKVDVRSILALGQLLSTTDVTVLDFPLLINEDAQSRRQILISGFGDDDGASDDAVERAVSSYFMKLPAPLGGANVVSTAAGALVIFPFGEPVELLPSVAG